MGQQQSRTESYEEEDVEDGRRGGRRRRRDDDEEEEDDRKARPAAAKAAKPAEDEKQPQAAPQSYELKELPADVIRSDGTADGITADLMGDVNEEENYSPEVLEQMQKLRAEKRKRELEKDKKFDKEKEYPFIYGGLCTGANEFSVMIFTLVKVALYLAVLALCLKTAMGNYNLAPCTESNGKCMWSNATGTCVVASPPNGCYLECVKLDLAPEGCFSRQSSIDPSGLPTYSYTCLTDFNQVCIAQGTCPSSYAEGVKTYLLALLIVMGIAGGLDLIYVLPMLIFKGMHVDEFERLSIPQKLLIMYSRLWALLTHWVWAAGTVMSILVIMAVMSNKTGCSTALTSSGQPYEFFNDAILVSLVALVVHGIVIITGTYFRARVPLRGQLYRPSNDSTIIFPFGLDCKECRDKPRPRWASKVFQPHMQRENVVGCVCNCCSCLIDTLCLFSFQIGGWTMERLWKHRHFIGP